MPKSPFDRANAKHFFLLPRAGPDGEMKSTLQAFVPDNLRKRGLGLEAMREGQKMVQKWEHEEILKKEKEQEYLDFSKEAAILEDPDAALDDDCYFPTDGYDYSQHLKKIESSKLVEVEPVEAPIPLVKSPEEEELLKALDASEEAEYEDLEDDFFADLGGVKDEVRVLWGDSAEDFMPPGGLVKGRMPDLPPILEDETFEGDDYDQAFDDFLMAEYENDDEEEYDPQGKMELLSRCSGMTGLTLGAGAMSLAGTKRYGNENYQQSELYGEVEAEMMKFDPLMTEYLSELDLKKVRVVDKKKEEENVEERRPRGESFTSEGSVNSAGDMFRDFELPSLPKELDGMVSLQHYREEIEPQQLEEIRKEAVEVVKKSLEGVEFEYESPAVATERIFDDQIKRDKWDCETVLTTRTNTTNHPGKILRPMTIEMQKKKEKQEKQKLLESLGPIEEEEEEEEEEEIEIQTFRPRKEEKEDKKARKKAVKEMQKNARMSKKQSKSLYKEEKNVQSAELMRQRQGDVRPGVTRVKL